MLRTFILNKKLMVATLFFISLVLYGVDYVMLGSAKDLTIWFLGNLAFLPIYVIIVTIMIERVLKERERQSVMRKTEYGYRGFFQ